MAENKRAVEDQLQRRDRDWICLESSNVGRILPVSGEFNESNIDRESMAGSEWKVL